MLLLWGELKGERPSKAVAQTGFIRTRELGYQENLQCWSCSTHPKGERIRVDFLRHLCKERHGTPAVVAGFKVLSISTSRKMMP